MYFVEILGSKSKQQKHKNFNEIALIHQCHLRRKMTAFTKSFTNNKKQHSSLKILLKISSKVSEEI